MSRLGHFGPGAFLFLIGALYGLRALRLRWLLSRQGRLENLNLLILLAFAPLGMMIEWHRRTDGPISMVTAHHMVLFLLLNLEACFIFCWQRRALSRAVLVTFQAGEIAVIGLIFSAHNMGNPLFVAMHKRMTPLLFLAAALRVPVGTAAVAGSLGRTLEFLHSCALMVAGQLFFHIGVAFYLWDNYGTEGSKRDSGDAMEAAEKLNLFLALHFAAAAAMLAATQAALGRRGLLLDYPCDGAGDDDAALMAASLSAATEAALLADDASARTALVGDGSGRCIGGVGAGGAQIREGVGAVAMDCKDARCKMARYIKLPSLSDFGSPNTVREGEWAESDPSALV